MLVRGPEEVNAMASATFERVSGRADERVREVRVAAVQERRSGGTPSRSRAPRARGSALLRGLAATALIATGYVACLVGVRWLLASG